MGSWQLQNQVALFPVSCINAQKRKAPEKLEHYHAIPDAPVDGVHKEWSETEGPINPDQVRPGLSKLENRRPFLVEAWGSLALASKVLGCWWVMGELSTLGSKCETSQLLRDP